MKKLQLLHSYLIDSGLVAEELLHTTVTEGEIAFYVAGEPDIDVYFSRTYNAQIIINNYSESPDKLDAALVWWLGLYQPELVGKANGYGFEAEIINKETVNLYVVFQLTENIRLDIKNKEIINCAKPMVMNNENISGVYLALFDTVASEIVEFKNA